MRKYLFASVLIAGALVSLHCYCSPLCRKVKIRNCVFTIETAATPEEKAKGLGCRDSMAQNHGMLFVLERKEKCFFWMKGMRFPLDFLWIEGNRIVDITQKVPTAKGKNLPVYSPGVPVDRVLELNAGTVEKLGISKGDTITLLP